MITGAGKFEICKAGQQAGNSGKISMLQPGGRIPSSLGKVLFVSQFSYL